MSPLPMSPPAAAWPPLFFVAAGLVLERGGMLSHGAIVARECGLPALVNVAHATHAIATGDEILLDADRGVVVCTGAVGGGGEIPEGGQRIPYTRAGP